MSYKSVFRFILFGLTIVVLMVMGLGLKLYLMNLKAESYLPTQSRATSSRSTPAIGPLRLNATNPRYFTDGSGRAVYLTGSHTWANFQDAGASDPPPVFDYDQYLNFLATHHHNFFRLWAWEQAKGAPWATDGMWFSPSIYQRPGPGTALDSKPKFDVTQFNQVYFDRLRARVIQAGQQGIYVSIMLFNGFSVDNKGGMPGNGWPGHPYHSQNNINGVDGDANHNGEGEETHTLQISAVTELQEAYVQKVIDTVNDLDNVLYEISNESHANSQDWQVHMINFIKNTEAKRPKQHPVGMTVEYPAGDNGELFASPADWISPNDTGGYKDNPPVADGSKVVIVDTDHLWGVGGDRQWVWKSFTRGYNPIYMDCYATLYCEDLDPNDPTLLGVRRNMGATLVYAQRMNLAAMFPRPDLCSTEYCLANPAATGAEYLVYLPAGNTATTLLSELGVQKKLPVLYSPNDNVVTVNLSTTPGELNVEWFNPETGETSAGGVVSGGVTRAFKAPFSGDAVLYLYQQTQALQFQLYLPVVGQGAVTVNPPGSYSAGQQVRLSAIPAAGWNFTGWDGATMGVTNPLTITITQNTTITATFSEQAPSPTYVLALDIQGEGKVAVYPAGPYHAGQMITVTAIPTLGWSFVGWRGPLSGLANPATFTISNSMVLTTTFIQTPVGSNILLVRTNGNGTVAISTTSTFTQGEIIQLTALPDPNWRFVRWGGALANDVNPITITITGNLTIAADFTTQVFMPTIVR